MINKISLFVCVLLFNQIVISQVKETCEGSDDSLLDLNTITKCTIEKTTDKKSDDKEVKIQISSRRRVVRNRKSSNDLHTTTSGIKDIKNSSSIVSSLELSREKVVEKVPFALVEEIPLFKKCVNVPIKEQKSCFNKKINHHIATNLVYPKEAHDKGIQGRVLTQFVIDKYGNVIDINLRGPYKGELLEKEAKRIISTLPKFKPGKHNGKFVKVKYGVPISFKIPGRAPSNVRVKDVDLSETVNFNTVNQIPAFKSCSKNKTEVCFNEQLIKYINNHFTYPKEAVNNNIEGKVLIYFVINKNGEISNIKTRAPEGCYVLEQATKKLFEELPTFIPGKHNGGVVNVKHVFPVDFKLD